MKLCGFEIGLDKPFFLIAGPCVIESRQLAIDTAGALKEMTSELGIPFIYKSSYDKANRSSSSSFRGPGMERARHPGRCQKTVQHTGIDRCSYRIGNRAGRPDSRRPANTGFPVPPDRLHPGLCPLRQARQYQKRAVPCSGRRLSKRCEKSERGRPGSRSFGRQFHRL